MRSMAAVILMGVFVLLAGASVAQSKKKPLPWSTTGNELLDGWFEREVSKLEKSCLSGPVDGDAWKKERPRRHEELREMLGLMPWPERTPLKTAITGRVKGDGFRVEKLHYQSVPGLYVTANLYLPEKVEKPLPAILYVCGHARAEKDGVSYGNKTSYHHHGVWFARNGYVCLVMDTIQLGEIPGIHHGTHRFGMWWWNSRGYTPAGVEAWNGMRALDYLETRPEVDASRFGVTGRSGGGAYSWWIAALDERIAAAAPVAGITDLRNHVVDGCVEGHCDCMFMVNTYRWDYPMLAAMVAPRALLILNSDNDRIFPLDGVIRTHAKVAKVYRALAAKHKLGLVITPGPHKDTQELRVPAFRWFNKWLKEDESPIREPAEKCLEMEQLKVFEVLPEDEITTEVHETFVSPAAPEEAPEDSEDLGIWVQNLREDILRLSLGAWPEGKLDSEFTPVDEIRSKKWKAKMGFVRSELVVPVPVVMLTNSRNIEAENVVLHALSESEWRGFGKALGLEFGLLPSEVIGVVDEGAGPVLDEFTTGAPDSETTVHVFVGTLGAGPTEFPDDRKKRTQIRRRFQLLGWTLDSFRALQLRTALQWVHRAEGTAGLPVRLDGGGEMSLHCQVISLFEPDSSPAARDGSLNFREGPDFLNLLRVVDEDGFRELLGALHALGKASD